eukprot:3933249-Rhodomonas_salina.1
MAGWTWASEPETGHHSHNGRATPACASGPAMCLTAERLSGCNNSWSGLGVWAPGPVKDRHGATE